MFTILNCINLYVNRDKIDDYEYVKQLAKLPSGFLQQHRHQSQKYIILNKIIKKGGKNSGTSSLLSKLQSEIQKQKELIIIKKSEADSKYYKNYEQLLKQVIILSLSTSQSLVHDTLKQTQTLLQSTYTDSIQYATNLYIIVRSIDILGIDKVSEQISEYISKNILGIIGLCQTNQYIKYEDIVLCLQCVAIRICVSDNSNLCRNYAKFIQMCIMHVKNQHQSDYFVVLLLDAIKFKIQYTQIYKSIQESLYTLYQNLDTFNRLQPKFKLRLEFLLYTVLAHDHQYAIGLILTKTTYFTHLTQLCNLYDFQFYEEYFMFLSAVCKTLENGYFKAKVQTITWQTFNQCVVDDVQLAIKSMLFNLDYGVHRKEVISSTQAIARVAMMLDLSEHSLGLVDYALKVGQSYWGFERHTSLTLLKLIERCQKIEKISQGAVNLLQKFILIQEYRGEDSAILLTQHNILSVYTKNMLHPEGDYNGTAIRFITIEWSLRQLNQLVSLNREQMKDNDRARVKMWLDIFERILNFCISDTSKDRMFITGPQKTKLKYCQFLTIFPLFIQHFLPQKLYNDAILKIFRACFQINLAEVRYYLETILLKLFYISTKLPICFRQLTLELAQQLSFIEGQTSLHKNISLLVLGGLLLQINFQQELFSMMFSSACSHIAYYRGVCQYFCFSLMTKGVKIQKDANYIQSMFKQYQRDENARRLTDKIEAIVEKFSAHAKNWNIYQNLLPLKPTVNGQVISPGHYLEQLKHLGTSLITQHKHEDGFMPYRDIWKKAIQSNTFQEKKVAVSDQGSFQKKIDPSLDDIYGFEPQKRNLIRNELRVIVVSAQNVALYGHMARVGEILGVSELRIPNLNIVDMEEFYTVSVTAQKWLNITSHQLEPFRQKWNQKQVPQRKKQAKKPTKAQRLAKPQKTIDPVPTHIINKTKFLAKLKAEKDSGYTIYILQKSIDTKPSPITVPKKKSIVIIDELKLISHELKQLADDTISYGLSYSGHVEATLFIWEYFKANVMRNQ